MQAFVDALRCILENYPQDIEECLEMLLAAAVMFKNQYEPYSGELPILLDFFANVASTSVSSLLAKFNSDPNVYTSYVQLALEQYDNQQIMAFSLYLGMFLRMLFSPVVMPCK
eukprot:TRINITY_DN7361_c0_g4_i1.p1 TRINITY_DN7361_c0_g4~~TRINITY_DN7361_c0_g4_i1.p1  ORF type:complete len:113 (-),score=8.71 TRINITY_DN7361_c0_g4_i1:198-536(-)